MKKFNRTRHNERSQMRFFKVGEAEPSLYFSTFQNKGIPFNLLCNTYGFPLLPKHKYKGYISQRPCEALNSRQISYKRLELNTVE